MNQSSDRFIRMQSVYNRKDRQTRGGMIPARLSGSQQKHLSKQNYNTQHTKHYTDDSMTPLPIKDRSDQYIPWSQDQTGIQTIYVIYHTIWNIPNKGHAARRL